MFQFALNLILMLPMYKKRFVRIQLSRHGIKGIYIVLHYGILTNIFLDTLYNSVPYDTNHMKLIEREIMSRVQKCNDESYNITVPDVYLM